MKQLLIQTDDSAQQIVDYLNAANTVTRCAMQVINTTLPSLVTPPENYGNYAQTFQKVKSNALPWVDEILVSFNVLPDSYISFNALFQSQLEVIENNLQTLKKSPGNITAISNIKSAIGALVNETNPGITYFSALGQWITSYGNNLQPDADHLTSLCTQIMQAEKVDEAAVVKLQAVYSMLQQMVDDENELITLATVGNVIFNIFIGVVGVAIGIPFTGPAAPIIIGLLFGAGSAVYTTLDPIMNPPPFAQDQKALQEQMNTVNAEIGAMNTIVGQLSITNKQFQNLIDQSAEAGKCISQVLGFWQHLQNDLTSLVTELETVLNDLTSTAELDQAIQDIQMAKSSWNDLQTYMDSIKKIKFVLPTGVMMPENTPLPEN